MEPFTAEPTLRDSFSTAYRVLHNLAIMGAGLWGLYMYNRNKHMSRNADGIMPQKPQRNNVMTNEIMKYCQTMT